MVLNFRAQSFTIHISGRAVILLDLRLASTRRPDVSGLFFVSSSEKFSKNFQWVF